MSYFGEHWKPKTVHCTSPNALSGMIDRCGMGNLGKLPTELIIEVFKNIPFSQRLKMTLLVSKSFQGLIHEKSIWTTIGIDGASVAPTLAYMIYPTPPGRCPPLIEKGVVKELSINMKYCTTGSVITIIKRLQLQEHALTTLSMIGSYPLLMATVIHLCRQAKGGRINLSQITRFTLTGGRDQQSFYALPSEFSGLMASMPNLLHLEIGGKKYRYGQKMKVNESMFKQMTNRRLKTLVAPFWEVSLNTMVQLGAFFPELEIMELGMTAPSCIDTVADTVAVLKKLREARITYHVDFSYTYGGASEGMVSRYFIGLISNAPELQELVFEDETHLMVKKGVELGMWAKNLKMEISRGVESHGLWDCTLKGGSGAEGRPRRQAPLDMGLEVEKTRPIRAW